jgi:hypothetical protein
MEGLIMRYVHCAYLALPAFVALAGCGHDEPARTTQVIVQP